jgi:serine/threonine-protein kinase
LWNRWNTPKNSPCRFACHATKGAKSFSWNHRKFPVGIRKSDISPEQARGRPVDRRSDVWSFGCLLFECLTGHPAFAGETVSDLIARAIERESDLTALPSDTPPRVREIVRRCLRKDAAERPRDIRDVRLELTETTASGGAGDTRGAAARAQSIAVLPFENLSGADDEYFADGITDEIQNALAQLEGLHIAARTLCFAFKGRREDLRVVGEKLDVATVLEGTVRRSGARLRITVQLVNAADGYQLWSERYDREMRGGVYKGDFTPCDPAPCITPVREVTWGWIKNRYRGESTGP